MAKTILQRLAVKDDAHHGHATTKWINPDISPLPPNRRTWGIVAYLGWASIVNVCITAWTGGSAILSLGLSVPETIGVIVIGRVIVGVVCLANGWIGGDWHIGFTMTQRMVLGVHGSYVGMLARILLSIVWYASQAWLGGLCVSVMLSSWSYSFLTMKNTLPPSAHMVTRDFVGFVIFQAISAPVLLIRIEKTKWPIVVANLISFIVMLGITIWACTTAGGTGPLFKQGATQVPSLSHSWAWVYGIISGVGASSAGILNQSDFTRFSTKQGVQVPGIIFALLVPGIVVPIMGIVTASASVTIYGGEAFWNPLTLITQWMLEDYSAKVRAGAFFCGFGLILSQIAENVISNGYAAGMDLAGLFPKYIDIRRGCMICVLLSFAVQPWLFYNTASVFVAVASSFSVFLGPLTGVMLADYFIIRKRRIEISQLYTGSPEGSYYYTKGVNWRAIITWFGCFAPAMPGMIASVNPSVVVSEGLLNYYRGNYIFGVLEAATLYTAICWVFKIQNAGKQDGIDVYGTFTGVDAERKGMVPFPDKKDEEVNGIAEHCGSITDIEGHVSHQMDETKKE